MADNKEDLDSGVDDFNDLELAGSIDLIPSEEEVLPLFWDVTGHGSSVAGIIAAEKKAEIPRWCLNECAKELVIDEKKRLRVYTFGSNGEILSRLLFVGKILFWRETMPWGMVMSMISFQQRQ